MLIYANQGAVSVDLAVGGGEGRKEGGEVIALMAPGDFFLDQHPHSGFRIPHSAPC